LEVIFNKNKAVGSVETSIVIMQIIRRHITGSSSFNIHIQLGFSNEGAGSSVMCRENNHAKFGGLNGVLVGIGTVWEVRQIRSSILCRGQTNFEDRNHR
jgi:hypothetical protein